MSSEDNTQSKQKPHDETKKRSNTTGPESNDSRDKSEEEKNEELAIYGKLRQQVTATLKNISESINGESISKAVDKAGLEIKEFGEHSVETVTKVMETMKKDLASTAETMKPKLSEAADQAEKTFKTVKEKGGAFWQEFSTEGGHALEVSRDIGGAFFSRFAKGLGEMSQKIGGKVDELLIYKEGEATHGGTFKCVSCGSTIKLDNPGHIPKCSECEGTEFRRA